MKLASAILALALAVPTLAAAAPPTAADVSTCVGETGALAPVFDSLRYGMTAEEAGAAWPGAEKVDKYGFAKLKAKDCAGAKTFVLFFMKDKTTQATKLASARIEFDPALSRNADFYKTLQDVLVAKYGPIKGGEKDIERRILTWATKEGVAQLTQHAKGPFTLSVPLARPKK